MRNLPRAPSVVPADATIYLVLDDFGSAGLAYRETGPDAPFAHLPARQRLGFNRLD